MIIFLNSCLCELIFLNKIIKIRRFTQVVASWIKGIHINVVEPYEISDIPAKSNLCSETTGIAEMIHHLFLLKVIIVYISDFAAIFHMEH